MNNATISGVILAGGKATRMGGIDKGLQILKEIPLIKRVAERLRPQVDRLMINANRNLASYAKLGYPVVEDAIAGLPGPLAGLHAGLRAARDGWVVSAPCDCPYLPADLVARLRAALDGTPAQLAIAVAEGRAHPVFAMCHTKLHRQLEAFLLGGGRRVMQWCETMGALKVDFSDQAAAFRNFNTIDELQNE